MINNYSLKKGFTLIELLVVVAIISLLAIVVLNALDSVRIQGRDLKRIQDLKQLQIALELQYNDTGSFPPISNGLLSETSTGNNSSTPSACGVGNNWGEDPSGLRSLVGGGYISSLSLDPLNSSENAHCYSYVPNTNGRGACVWTTLERLQDNWVGVFVGQSDISEYQTGFPLGFACGSVRDGLGLTSIIGGAKNFNNNGSGDFSCRGTPSVTDCITYTDLTSCESNNSHGGCSSIFGGICLDNPTLDCSSMDEETCATYSAGCVSNQHLSACPDRYICSAGDGTDENTCLGISPNCRWNSSVCESKVDCLSQSETDCAITYNDICYPVYNFSSCSTIGSCSSFDSTGCPTTHGCSTEDSSWVSCLGQATCQNDVNYCNTEAGCSWSQ